MQTEIEAKFLNVDHQVVRKKLKNLNARLAGPLRLMRRRNFDYPDKRLEKKSNGWLRLRDEGDKVTLSYKQLNDRTLHGTKEVCIEVDSFEQTKQLLGVIGLCQQSYQETKRESWKLDKLEIELDEWPWIPPFLEIEAPAEREIRELAEELGLNWSDALFGSVETAYQAVFDVTEEEVNRWPEITFGPVPDWLEKRRI